MFFPSRTGAGLCVLALAAGLSACFGSGDAWAAVELSIGSASGDQGDTVDIPINLSGNAMASTILFSIAYDADVLQFVALHEGSALDLDQWIISTPSVLSRKVAVAIYGGGNYLHDGEVCVVSFRILTASAMGSVLSSGGDASAASLMNVSLPVLIAPGNIFANCEGADIEAVTNAAASQGDSDGVTVSWDATVGASGYQVYRSKTNSLDSARAVTGWLTGVTSWLDTSAAAPELAPFGCQGAEAAATQYYYWVRAKDASGCPGPFSASALGWRGDGKAFYATEKTYEKALPGRAIGGGVFEARENGSLALRLVTDQTVAPQTVWGTVSSDVRVSQKVRWVPLESGGGWVVYEPEFGLVPGERLSMTAGASTIGGGALDGVSAEFVVVDAAPPSAAAPSAAAPSAATLTAVDTAVALPDGVAPAWRVGQGEVFDAPVCVTLPLPEGKRARDLQLCYFKETGPDAGWYPADHVEGWLVEGSLQEVNEGGQLCVSFEVRHSGVMQLRVAAAGASAGVTPLVGAFAALLGLGMVQRRNRK